jgi:hypothetical protein
MRINYTTLETELLEYWAHCPDTDEGYTNALTQGEYLDEYSVDIDRLMETYSVSFDELCKVWYALDDAGLLDSVKGSADELFDTYFNIGEK